MKDLERYAQFPIESEDKLFAHKIIIQEAIDYLKKLDKDVDQELIQLMNTKGIKEFTFGNGEMATKVYLGKKTTNRFDSEKLIDFILAGLGVVKVPESAQDREHAIQAIKCLPKNPSWKKTEVLKLMERTKELLHWEDVEDEIQLKKISVDRLNLIQKQKELQNAD